jgi:hypothetical protein
LTEPRKPRLAQGGASRREGDVGLGDSIVNASTVPRSIAVVALGAGRDLLLGRVYVVAIFTFGSAFSSRPRAWY